MTVVRVGIRLSFSIVALALLGCAKDAMGPGTTGEFGLTGSASVLGVVLDSLQQPLDSVHIAVDVPDGQGLYLYTAQQLITSADGSFNVLVERRGSHSSADSTAATITATSIRARHARPNGSRTVVTMPVWLRFVSPPLAPTSTRVTVPVPVTK